MTKTLLLIGCGYSATRLAARMGAQGWRVIGTSRGALDAPGVVARRWPGEEIAPDIAAADAILSSVGPAEGADPVLAAYRDALAEAPARFIGYLSTTAIYGDAQGGWVDETTPPAPASARGRDRLRAEQGWMALHRDHDRPAHIFRLSAIYGPGRGPLAKMRAGRARSVVKPGQIFNRIHVDDIARAVEAAIAAPRPGAIWNLADDAPAPPEEVMDGAADLLGLPRPARIPFDEAEMSPMARSFYGESKRVSAARIKRDLELDWLYPDWRAGLAACLT